MVHNILYVVPEVLRRNVDLMQGIACRISSQTGVAAFVVARELRELSME